MTSDGDSDVKRMVTLKEDSDFRLVGEMGTVTRRIVTLEGDSNVRWDGDVI